jgi:hypothetical protein
MFNFDYENVSTGMVAADLVDGTYDGIVEASELKDSKAGDKFINLKIKLVNGAMVYERLNLENKSPKAKEIAQQKVQSIIAFGVEKPEAKFTDIAQVAGYLKGIPVRVFYKNKGMDERGYAQYSLTFKPLDAGKKVAKAAAGASVY